MVTIEDLTGLHDEIELHQESLHQHLKRMQDAVVPERAGVFLNAANHTNELLSSPLNAVQSTTAVMLHHVFSVNQENVPMF